MRAALATLLAVFFSAARAADLEIGGYILCGNDCLVIIRDPVTKLRSPWMKLGEQWNGYFVTCNSAGVPFVKKAAVHGQPSDAPPYDGYQEYLVEVRASPSAGFTSKRFEKFTLTADGKTYRLDWSVGTTHHAPMLSPGQLYDFVLVEHSFPKKYGSDTWHSIARISRNGQVLFDSKICETHGGTLQEKFVPYRCGYTGLDFAKAEARTHLFPHSESGRSIPCEGFPDDPAVIAIQVCASCERAYHEWTATRESRRP